MRTVRCARWTEQSGPVSTEPVRELGAQGMGRRRKLSFPLSDLVEWKTIRLKNMQSFFQIKFWVSDM